MQCKKVFQMFTNIRHKNHHSKNGPLPKIFHITLKMVTEMSLMLALKCISRVDISTIAIKYNIFNPPVT